MKQQYEQVKVDYNNTSSPIARRGIHEEMKRLKKKIDDEERRLNSNLEIVNINGAEYKMPARYQHYQHENRYTFEVKDSCLYIFDKMKTDKDGSFHIWCHVWIPQQENKYVDLLVRILGGDMYGERYFLEASYYKHPSDTFSYLNKVIRTDNYGYKPYYTYVIDKMGFKRVKHNWDTNKIEWKDGGKQ
ncbi:hypothetical protein ACH6EH_07130 [Paenibacillus sp. JSM ZJ436]|uniref:hypothetical protein n=1 Tax=Paenibacillus sp. JSM ZJ436 TaxID=3376190 RepID=UPI0037A10ED5